MPPNSQPSKKSDGKMPIWRSNCLNSAVRVCDQFSPVIIDCGTPKLNEENLKAEGDTSGDSAVCPSVRSSVDTGRRLRLRSTAVHLGCIPTAHHFQVPHGPARRSLSRRTAVEEQQPSNEQSTSLSQRWLRSAHLRSTHTHTHSLSLLAP